MTIGFALDYIPRIMKARGIENYLTYFRHIQVEGRTAQTKIAAGNHFYLFIPSEEIEEIIIESKLGKYALEDDSLNELQYEHTGNIIITNNNRFPQYIRFIQVVPERKTKD